MSELYALLIGIDYYFPGRLPDGGYYPILGGCARDIRHIEDVLKQRLGLAPDHLFKLTATSNDNKSAPLETAAQLPTYANMVAKFKQLTAVAKPGDQIYIHYSGHGGRATTIYPSIKGLKGLDEGLVPTDIHASGTQYLRDVELAHLLQVMVDKGLLVTIVLDSCHSGGNTRGVGGAVARGIASIDTTERPPTEDVATQADLVAGWQQAAAGTRNVKPGSGWLIVPQGYTLLAACRGTEVANEYPFVGTESNGALTFALLDALRQLGPGLTYKMLHERVLAKVHSQFESQTPQLQGERDRVVFGSEQVKPQFATTVLQVEPKRVLLDAGQAHGLRKGAQFVIYPSGANLAATEQRLALAELATLGATDSWATITKQLRPDKIEQGAQAVVLDSGNVNLQRPVRFFKRTGMPASIDQAAALAKAQQALNETGSTFARLAAAGEAVAFQVVVNKKREYELWDAAGSAILNLRPPLSIDDPAAAKKLAQRLIHLAKFRNVQELANFDSLSPLARALVVEIAGKASADYDPADPPAPKPFDPAASKGFLKPGEWVFLRIRNLLPNIATAAQPWLNSLNITVFDLQPDWGISQVYPSDPATAFLPLDPAGELLLPFQAVVPAGYEQIKDILKVFATLGTTNFRWLELPALDQPSQAKGATRGSPSDPLEQLLEAVAGSEPKTRQLNPAAAPSKGWVTGQVELRIKA